MISIGADVFDCIENNDKRTNRIATAYIALVCNVLRGKNWAENYIYEFKPL